MGETEQAVHREKGEMNGDHHSRTLELVLTGGIGRAGDTARGLRGLTLAPACGGSGVGCGGCGCGVAGRPPESAGLETALTSRGALRMTRCSSRAPSLEPTFEPVRTGERTPAGTGGSGFVPEPEPEPEPVPARERSSVGSRVPRRGEVGSGRCVKFSNTLAPAGESD